MDTENKLAKRKPNRLKTFDYSTNGAYFITVCIKDKQCILGTVGNDVPGVPQNNNIPKPMAR